MLENEALALLSSVWRLGDVEDVERLVATVAGRAGLGADEDAIAYLFEVVWRAWRRYEPGRAAFSTLAYRACQRGAVDYRRKRDGRTRWRFGDGRVFERTLPVVASFDRLDEPLLARDGDPALDCDPDLGRLLAAGGGSLARDYNALGLESPGRAAG